MPEQIIACPICSSHHVQEVLRIPAVPVHANLLLTDRQTALSAPQAEIDLAFCASCGHVFNRRFDPERMDYPGAYENSLHFSPTFQAYATELATSLVDRWDLHGKRIIEIGSGDGEFLRLLCDLGGCRGWGFDPSRGVPPDLTTSPAAGEVVLVRSAYSGELLSADFILFRHLLEHLGRPLDFLVTVRAAALRSEATVFCEVPNSLYTFRWLGIWDLIYEHPSFFSPISLQAAFQTAGFKIIELEETYGGQFLTLAARPAGEPQPPSPGQAAETAALARDLASFAGHFHQKTAAWKERLAALQAAGKQVVVWGAGSKGVTFLNLLARQSAFVSVVDLNPRKQGGYIAGTGHPILAPETLRTASPDVVIVMNPNYRAEIETILAHLGLPAEILEA